MMSTAKTRPATQGSKPAINSKNANVLTLDEYKQMRNRIQIGGLTEEQERKLQEKKEMKEKADARTHNWPNTIQNLRKKKDDSKFEKFQREEEERRKIDIEEAAYQRGVKQEILGKANKQIYETNDRVKAFQSALLLSDAMQEREAQMEIDKKKKEIEKIVESRWLEVEKENMKAYDEKEEEKRLKEIEKTKANQKVLKEQHHLQKIKNIKKMQEEKIEGEIIKIKAQEEIVKQKEEEKAKRDRALLAQEETRKANDLLQDLKHKEKLKELEQEKQIEAFAKRKEDIMDMRKQREELKFKERQAVRQKIIDDQVERLKKIKDREDELINKNIKEAEIKAEENERIKKEKRAILVKEIDKQIGLTLEKKKNEKEKQKVEDKNFQEFWRNKNKELEEKERADMEAHRQRCKNLEDYRRKQADQKHKKVENEILKEYDDALRMKAAIEDEERVFQSYAQKAIQEWQANGKNIKPLLIELEKYKKKTT